MGRKTLQVKGYTPDQIRSLFRSEDKHQIGLRLYAVYQVSLGQPTRKLQELYNTSFKQICNWVHAFERKGIDGLKNQPKSGRRPRLSAAQLEQVAAVLLHRRPDELGYNTATWNGPLLADYIRSTFGVEYKRAQIYNILKGLGFSFQKGRVRYPEADPEARERFKGLLKKTPGGAGGHRHPV